MQNAAPGLRGISRIWVCGVAVLGFAAPPCMAQRVGAIQVPDWMPWGLIALLFGVLALDRWRIHHLAVQARQRELVVSQRIEGLERENSELLRTQEQMREYAERDGLTGLWNHRIIMQRLRQEVDRSRREGVPLSVIMVDLDEFKNVNDTYGHQAGDRVLNEIGAILQSSVRSYDWVGRYGGEEFLLILPGSSFTNARIRAEHFRMAVQTARIQHGETAIHVTASFGVASGFPTGSEEMIYAADTALYRAKDNKRNCVMATEIEPPGSSAETIRAELPAMPENEGTRT